MAFKSIIQETKGETIFLRGIAKWAHVQEADQYGNFSINIYPTTDNLIEFTNQANDIRDRAVKEVEEAGKQVKGIADTFKQDDQTVEYIQCKLPLEGYDDKENKIEFIGLDGSVLEDFDELVGNGSEVMVKIYCKPYYMNSTKMVGVSNKFYAIQIIKLVKFTSGNDSGFGDLSSKEDKVNKDTGFSKVSTSDEEDFGIDVKEELEKLDPPF